VSWEAIYDDKSIAGTEPKLVEDWRIKLRALGFDDPTKLHPFVFEDLAHDLPKHRMLLAYNMGLSKTASSIAAAAVRGTKHTLFVVPNKLMIEWEKEFARLGFGDQFQIITSLAQIDRYDCPKCGIPVGNYRKVLDVNGKLADVKRECPTCGSRLVWADNLRRFNLISMRMLWAFPQDSPHHDRPQKKAAVKDKWGYTQTPARSTLKYSFAWYLRRRTEAVTVDEAYSIGNPDALQTRAINLLKPRRRTLLTGTPIRGYPDNILALLNWCLGTGTDLFPDFDYTQENSRRNFLDLFGTTIQKRRDDGTTYDKLIPKIKNPERFQAMLAPVMRRRVNLEPTVAKAIRMPEFVIHPVQIDPDSNLREMYEYCVADFVKWYEERIEEAKRRSVYGNTPPPVPQVTLLTKLNYLANLAACPQAIVAAYKQVSSKQARILHIIEKAVERGRKVILYSEFLDSVDWYSNSPLTAKYNPVSITGSVSLSRSKRTGTSERDRRLLAFREGDSSLLVASTRAVAEGFNIPEASVVIFDSFPWVPSLQQQAWSRVLRPAQKERPVEIYLVGLTGTIDDYLSAICAIKRTAIAEGIDYETVEIDADDVPDPYQYAGHLVQASNTVSATYNKLGWIERLKEQAAEAQRHQEIAWRALQAASGITDPAADAESDLAALDAEIDDTLAASAPASA
jgi:predicted RNA-binding Zn-ribbon protein involved in translation (DUF1610 family)